MPRTGHNIKANHGSAAPRHFIFVDTEADATQTWQTLWFGCAIRVRIRDEKVSEDRCYFTTIDEFWDWVESHTGKGWSVWIMAHNWNYDAGILAADRTLRDRGWTSTKYINGRPPFIAGFKRGSASIRLVDTMNYFTVSLQALGQATGLDKLTMPDTGASYDDWVSYCWRDVEIIKDAVLAFRELVIKQDLGTMQTTLASQSFTAFRHRFMRHEILCHDDDLALELERESYHGGRTEALYYGRPGVKLYKLDINSMYPAIMRNGKFSARLIRSYKAYRAANWQAAIEAGHGLVARCYVDTGEPCYGVVRDAKLIFPIGRFWATLSTPEVLYATEKGHIKEIGSWAEYEREPLFREFVDYFYTLRQEYREAGNPAFAYMVKILMNSFYGKFGQNGRKWVDTDDYYCPYTQITGGTDENGNPVKLRNRLGQTQILQQEGESENSCPIIAAEITAQARIQLWEYMQKAGVENAYYVDTDSVAVDDAGLEKLAGLVDSTKLGYLKIEKETESAEILAPKHYTLDQEWKIKGVRQTAHVYSDIATGILYAQQPMFRSVDYGYSQGWDGGIEVLEITKKISARNTKRQVNGPGWTSPLELWE